VIDNFLMFCETHKVAWVDVVFTDWMGKLNTFSYPLSAVSAAFLADGATFDGSSIPYWRSINQSDLIMKPDLASFYLDPLADEPTVTLWADVLDPATGLSYACDGRGALKRAISYAQELGIADEICMGPELEFFVFDERMSHRSDYASSLAYACGEIDGGHVGPNRGYGASAPQDMGYGLRQSILAAISDMGVEATKHHHEVASGQHEIGFKYNTPVHVADHVHLIKKLVATMAQRRDKSATFMPKPLATQNGSGMHIHISMRKEGANIFAGNQYGGLSQTAMYFIGGVMAHGRAICAFTNPTVNSYKRLVPGFEAPALLCYSEANRSAACRIPHAPSSSERRVEMRFPDASGHTHLAMTALIMAGIDGIVNKIDPGAPQNDNVYDKADTGHQAIPGSLPEALSALMANQDFLCRGGVLSHKALDAYRALKRDEVDQYHRSISPWEIETYFNN
jgi:glutamine synthetase